MDAEKYIEGRGNVRRAIRMREEFNGSNEENDRTQTNRRKTYGSLSGYGAVTECKEHVR